MRWLPAILASLLLTSCWTGQNLYSHPDARPAIPPGIYRMIGPDAAQRIYKVSMQADGMTELDDSEKKEIYGFAPLDRDTFVAWLDIRDEGETTDPTSDENQMFALMVRGPDGSFYG